MERNVQTTKHLFKKAYDEGNDAEMALLEFQNTTITGLDQSPAQLLMSRHICSSLSMTVTMFQPSIYERMRERLKQQQQHQKCAYDRGAKALASLQPNDVIRYQAGKVWKPSVIISQHANHNPTTSKHPKAPY